MKKRDKIFSSLYINIDTIMDSLNKINRTLKAQF